MGDRRTALVTGASRGIGAATARALASTHRVLLAGRDAEALDVIARELPDAAPMPFELTEPASRAAAVDGIDELDVLVHSAGVVDILPLAETSEELWRTTLDVNIVAVAELTRLLLPALRASGGTVVLIDSGQGRTPSANWGAYAASKSALRAYADVLRAEEPRLRVTTVYPGRTATEMQRGVRAAEGGAYEPQSYLRAESVADAVRYAAAAPPDAVLTEMVLRPRRH